MPICNKPPPQALASKSATEIDDHASEAAKVKRTREQAYFNSYNFDAIEVLPYDEDDGNDADAKSSKKRTKSSQQQHTHAVNIGENENLGTSSALYQRSLPIHHGVGVSGVPIIGRLPPNASLSSSSRRSSSQSSSSDSYTHRHHHNNSMQYSYLQRLGSFFVTANTQSAALKPSEDEGILAQNSRRSGNAAHSNNNSSEVIVSVKNNNKDEENGNFLLPRAMLKYQSVGNIAAANSMPVATNTGTHAGGIDKLLHQNGNSSGNNNNSHATNINKSKKSMMMATTANNTSINANILCSSSNMSNINNTTRLNYTNSNNISTGFLIAKIEKDSATAAAPTAALTTTTAAARNKKQSTSSTLTSTSNCTSSVVSVEHELQKPPTIVIVGISDSSRNNVLDKMKSPLSSANTNAGNNSSSAIIKRAAAATAAESGERRGRTNSHSQSHYSTDKSGSSGYYSSNVCSTYSLEDHIYCEPVIDILDLSSKSKSVVGGCGSDAVGKALNNIVASQQQQHLTTLQTTATTTAKTKTLIPSNKVNESAAHSNSRNRDMNSIGQNKRFSGEDCNENEDDDDDDDDDDDEDDVAAVAGKVASNLGKVRLQINLRRPHVDHHHHQHHNDSQHFSENLRILETSIENLDRHLKNFPSLSSQERIVSFVQQAHTQSTYLQHAGDPVGGEKLRGASYHLPTIMEVYDPTNQSPPPRQWQETADIMDDSLLDIDLDSFLLVDERRCNSNSKRLTKSPTKQPAIATNGSGGGVGGGIDNPTFLTDEQEENNYKCVKYINSCPEDAYRVESDIVVAGGGGTGGTISEKSASVDHYLKRYEDQLHFQSTRELLEDVRDKIRLLSQSAASSSSNNSHQTQLDPDEELFPKELESMIKALKHELESYLDRMNQHSELEIRQLCSGLVKNQNIVKMKNAFERRRSTISVSADCEYEAIRDGGGGGVLVPISGVPISIRQQITSIRCASDPNFKMKRKSLAEVFPVADCYVESLSMPSRPLQTSSAEVGAGARATNITQLQRNLSFHQPILNQLDTQVGPNGLHSLGGGGLNSGSGAESGESADKDSILEWHRKKPSIWEMYYGTNRMNQSLLGKRMAMSSTQATMSYPSSRPESDFTLDLPRAEQLRIKMEKEKKFRQRCRYITTFLSLIFFLLTVMVVSLVLSRGKRMFGSMI